MHASSPHRRPRAPSHHRPRATASTRTSRTIWTVGHSNLSLERFLALVEPVEVLADIRRFPASRKFPWFDRASLAAVKPYRWFPDLGGRRHGGGERHAAFRVASFRAYAAYMETPAFEAALAELEALALCARTALLCSEAVWFRCHRWLVSDALVARGWTVLHLPGEKRHVLTSFARREGNHLVYDGSSASVSTAGDHGSSSSDEGSVGEGFPEPGHTL